MYEEPPNLGVVGSGSGGAAGARGERVGRGRGVGRAAVLWLWRHSDFRVEGGKKDDIISVSLGSPYPQGAADFVNAVVDSYVTYQSTQKRSTGSEMMRTLQNQKKALEVELDARLK